MTGTGDGVEVLPAGWCACWQRCGGVGVACVRLPGRGEYCLACAAADGAYRVAAQQSEGGAK